MNTYLSVEVAYAKHTQKGKKIMEKNVLIKNNVSKRNFILKFGYKAYRKLYYMAKCFNGTMDKIVQLSDDDIRTLLK